MPRMFNVSASHVVPAHIVAHDGSEPVIRHHDSAAVAPGAGEDFTDEEIEVGLASGAEWSDADPRAGLSDEISWKAERDAKPAKGRRMKDSDVTEQPTDDTAANGADGESDSPPTDSATADSAKE